MSVSFKWKLAAGFTLIFIAGLAAGAFIGATQSRRHHPDITRLADRLRKRMETRLDLTPDQLARTTPIFDKTAHRLEAIRTETGRRVHETMAEADRELVPELTDAQRAKLDAMIAGQDTRKDHRKRSDESKP